jgi:PKD repeat protein
MRHRVGRALAIAAMGLMLTSTAAWADNLQSAIEVDSAHITRDAAGNASVDYVAGDPAISVRYYIDETGTTCDAPATVTLSVPAEVSASETSFSLSDCGTAITGYHTVTFSSDTPGRYLIDASTSNAEVNDNPGDFHLHVDSGSTGGGGPTDAPPDVTSVSADTGAEGSPLSVSATVTDDGLSAVTTAWTYSAVSGVDAGATCSFADSSATSTTVTCTDDGSYEVKLTATDAVGWDSATADLIVSNANPAVNAGFDSSPLSCGIAAQLTINFTDAGSNDTHTGTVTWGDGTSVQSLGTITTGAVAGHTYASAGAKNASVTVTDDDGGSDTDATNAVTVNYTVVGGGVLQPINLTGPRSLFKYGSTIPVKVQLQNCDGSFPSNLAPTIAVRLTSGSTPVGADESISSTSSADTGTTMRFSPTDNIYIYNLATKSLSDPSAGYHITITVPSTGQKIEADFGLKK